MDILSVIGWFAAPAAASVISWLAAKLHDARRRERERDEAREAEHAAIVEGMRELMRERIYGMHEKYVVRGEPMPYEEKEREESVYRAYHTLGGNGTGTHLHEELVAAYVGGREEVRVD